MIKDRDRGYKKLAEAVFGAGKPKISVGVLEKDADVVEEKTGKTVLEVATYNEFGTNRTPARSFLRGWFDENEQKARAILAAEMRKVLARKQTQEQALERAGLAFVGQIQARMAQGIPPPNAASTVARKGSSKPLIDSGQLRSSISFKVDKS